MNLNDIIEKEDVRLKALNDNRSLDIMEGYKTITTINKTNYETANKVAEYFGVEYECIKKLIQRNKNELIKNGLLILSSNDVKNLLGDKVSLKKYRGGFEADNRRFNNKNNYLIDKRCFLNIAMLLTESKVAEDIRSLILDAIFNNTNIDNNNIELYNIINDLKNEIKGLREELKEIKGLNKIENNKTEKEIKNENFERLIKDINNLDYRVEFTKKEFTIMLDSYNFYDKHIGIKLLNEVLANNNMIRGNDILTSFSKDNNYLIKKKFKTNNKLYITREGMLYIANLLMNK